MANPLVELTAEIVISHASSAALTKEELLETIKEVYSTLEALEKGVPTGGAEAKPAAGVKAKRGRPRTKVAVEKPVKQEKPAEPAKPPVPEGPVLSFEEAFQPDEVGCMICGKRGMKTLKKHLSTEHGLKPGQYKRRFKIPKDVDLVAPKYAAARRQMAIDRGLPEKLAAARALRKKKAE
ncbi:MAG: MucR family transcriptional regulator [Deltaproteobacteria bacterium HGW-Deltaproteobacteria-19]|jgi:predicted transcriptional regulator|nr:MAG: MucR family transcriptional regulator [Deltaproteobacteria bacterium HGW-Deltaproteobacteria-19]